MCDIAEGEQRDIVFYVNGLLTKTCTVIGRKFCQDYKMLKYIDKNGQYRFYPFNDKWQQVDSPVSIGDKTNLVTSLLTGQGSTRQMGYTNSRSFTLTAYSVSQDELDKLSDIYISPSTMIYVGDGTTDREQDWVFVSVQGDGIGKPRKRNFSNITITVTLKDYYAITEI